MDSSSGQNRDDKNDIISDEEDLVEVRICWDVGKFLGLKVGNDKAMIASLVKVNQCQDFVMPRKRGRPKKNKSRK